ncbi:NAD(P)-dependent oxidoreductase [Lacisediminihabitans sp. H27-G8]|uniref:NAD(P)-dependent oxidoreductase n=1 Tax=Lacisediminihabitans sp. H27-G8 TaxID=3111909 RepID=UPI0038FC9D88
MSRITILGGTGYTGSNIAREAVARGHEVISFSRHAPESAIEGVRYRTGSMSAELPDLVSSADVVIGALAPRAELATGLTDVYATLAKLAAQAATRIGIVGGFSALRPAPDAPRMAYGDDVPPQFATEARVMAEVIDELSASAPTGLDWFYASPAATYGSYAPGEDRGTYRTGGEVAIFDASGSSAISGVDFARAILDEIEAPSHTRSQFGVAY